MILEMTKSQVSDSVKTAPTAATGRAQRASVAARTSGRRRLIDPTTCDREYSAAELEFMSAIQDFKARSHCSFPSWGDVLEVINELGYQRTEIAHHTGA